MKTCNEIYETIESEISDYVATDGVISKTDIGYDSIVSDLMNILKKWSLVQLSKEEDMKSSDSTLHKNIDKVIEQVNKEVNKERMIPIENLEDGKYYLGSCRNSSVAMWDDVLKLFIYVRSKYGDFLEGINHPELESEGLDVFIPHVTISDVSNWETAGKYYFKDKNDRADYTLAVIRLSDLINEYHSEFRDYRLKQRDKLRAKLKEKFNLPPIPHVDDMKDESCTDIENTMLSRVSDNIDEIMNGVNKILDMMVTEDDLPPPLPETPSILKDDSAQVVFVDTMETESQFKIMMRSKDKQAITEKLKSFIGPGMAEIIVNEKWEDKKQIDLIIQRSNKNAN
jgi:hypothetical protein